MKIIPNVDKIRTVGAEIHDKANDMFVLRDEMTKKQQEIAQQVETLKIKLVALYKLMHHSRFIVYVLFGSIILILTAVVTLQLRSVISNSPDTNHTAASIPSINNEHSIKPNIDNLTG